MTPQEAAFMAAIATLCAIGIVLIILPFLRKKKKTHPLLSETLELARFYESRPLPATVLLEYETRKEAVLASRADFPDCEPDALGQAVFEAEYNEFLKTRFGNEYRRMKKELAKTPKKIRLQALDELDNAKNAIPSGVQATIRGHDKSGMVAYERTFLYNLRDAQDWLDSLSPLNGGISRQERFQALKTARFRCARCGRDWDDDIELIAVRTKAGALSITCTDCRTGRKA